MTLMNAYMSTYSTSCTWVSNTNNFITLLKKWSSRWFLHHDVLVFRFFFFYFAKLEVHGVIEWFHLFFVSKGKRDSSELYFSKKVINNKWRIFLSVNNLMIVRAAYLWEEFLENILLQRFDKTWKRFLQKES